MKVARIFLKNSPSWLDLPLADGQDLPGLMRVMKTEGFIVTEGFAVREDAWSYMATFDVPAPSARVVPFAVSPVKPPDQPA